MKEPQECDLTKIDKLITKLTDYLASEDLCDSCRSNISAKAIMHIIFSVAETKQHGVGILEDIKLDFKTLWEDHENQEQQDEFNKDLGDQGKLN